MIIHSEIQQIVHLAIQEDIGNGDYSTLACIPNSKRGKAHLLVKDSGIIAGIELSKYIVETIDKELEFVPLLQDGTSILPNDIAFTLEGKVQSILKAERLMLNFLQRMSGIATRTSRYVSKLEGLNSKVLDTRKTTPGLRAIEKWAVKIGGGYNHRMGLYDMIMLKDNHIDYAGGIEQAIQKTTAYIKKHNLNLKIEVEARNLLEVEQIVNVGNIHRIMFDNFSFENTKLAVEMVNNRFETESSGGITLHTIRNYAECGVDYISVGELTHHIESLDLSLKAINY